MTTVYWLLFAQGLIGAFDTVYYHEWRARLPALGPAAAAELRLHAGRDFLYGVLFLGLPTLAWHGAWAWVLAAVVVAEIVLTLADFVVEIDVRKPLGDVWGGERVTHAVMGILYGAMIAYLLPTWRGWLAAPTALVPSTAPEPLRSLLLLMGVGVVLSGLRDLYASFGWPGGAWPWSEQDGRAEAPEG